MLFRRFMHQSVAYIFTTFLSIGATSQLYANALLQGEQALPIITQSVIETQQDLIPAHTQSTKSELQIWSEHCAQTLGAIANTHGPIVALSAGLFLLSMSISYYSNNISHEQYQEIITQFMPHKLALNAMCGIAYTFLMTLCHEGGHAALAHYFNLNPSPVIIGNNGLNKPNTPAIRLLPGVAVQDCNLLIGACRFDATDDKIATTIIKIAGPLSALSISYVCKTLYALAISGCSVSSALLTSCIPNYHDLAQYYNLFLPEHDHSDGACITQRRYTPETTIAIFSTAQYLAEWARSPKISLNHLCSLFNLTQLNLSSGGFLSFYLP